LILAYGQLAAAMVLVGINVVVGKLLAEALPIPVIACLRCILAAAVLWPLMRNREPGPIPRAPVLRNLFWQAAFGTALYNIALLAGLRLTSALEGGLVLSALPAAIAIGSALWLRERLAARSWLAALLAGVAMAVITLARTEVHAPGSLAGNALVLVAVFGEAVYVLLAKRVAGRVGVITASFWMQLFSALLLLPLSLIAAPDLAFGAIDARIGALLVFHSLTASVLALLLWFNGLRRAKASIAGVFGAFLPASAAVSAVLILGEQFGIVHAAGFAMMLASILLATWPQRSPYSREVQPAGTSS
jgi:drug/metabolite transporter (DMT)-like permease